MIPLAMLREHGRLLGFGFFMCLSSNFGQTFFISLFNADVRDAFGLSHGGIGAIYSAATIISAAVLIWAGRAVDRIPLAAFSMLVLGGLAAAAMLFAAAPNAYMLIPAIFMLRLFGQGLSTHTAMTAMGRYFDTHRGRAVSIASIGHPAGEALFPILIVTALAAYGWRDIWWACALIVLAALPVMLFLLKGHRERHAAFVARQKASGAVAGDCTLGQALRTTGLWLRLPALLAPSFIGTGLIFHQVHMADVKGWSMTLVSGSFTAYAAMSVVAAIVTGPLIDRFGARRSAVVFLAPMTLGALSVALFTAPWAVPLYLGLLGTSSGVTVVLLGALWPELYGTSHLGAIRAFGQAAMVFSTGLAPAALGLMIDAGIGLEAIAFGCALYCVAASALVLVANRMAET
ncbi:MAG: MFS transporter [Rhodospirillales bacterium]